MKKNSLVIEKNLIVWEGVEKPARFEMGGGSKCFGKREGGPVYIEAPGLRENTRSQCNGHKEPLLCIHSQGPEVVNSLGPGAREGVALGLGC